MIYNFCTLTDKNFAYKCIALLNSIDKHMSGSLLWVLCLDKESEALFKRLNKENLRTISVEDLENGELEKLRSSRTKQEFAWTCKPSLMSYLLEQKRLETLIFADSDLLFFSSVGPLFDLHKTASIMLTSHKFSARKAHIADIAGYFNSGFIVFRNDATSRTALKRWKEQCIDWCFNYHDKGRHGDQSYLNNWPMEYENIEVIPEKGVNLGTWNLERYSVAERDGVFSIDGEMLICYHFHGFIVYLGKDDRIKPYPITVHHAAIYRIYIQELETAFKEIVSIEPKWRHGFAPRLSLIRQIKQRVSQVIRKIKTTCEQTL